MSEHQWLQESAELLRSGEVIAYPTEAVWGLGCDPWDQAAVEKILAIKSRPMHKGLIVIAADIEQIEPLLRHLSAEELTQVTASWPGPVTWLLPDPDHWLPDWVRGEHESAAVRICGHPLAREICTTFGRPIISTSANRAGLEPGRTRDEVMAEFSSELAMIVPGEVKGHPSPSEIRDLKSGVILR